jgi:hypothetical protein
MTTEIKRGAMEPYTFDAELSLARMAVGFAGRHKSDIGCEGLVHQVRRLEKRYREGGFPDRADKLANILKWWDDGCPECNERVVLSFEETTPEVKP